MALTTKQRALIRELAEIMDIFGLDYWNVEMKSPAVTRTPFLETTKRALVRGQVIELYTLVDELLSCLICFYFFGRRRTFPQLWQTKRFQTFNYHVIEKLSLLDKLRLVKGISPVPRNIVKDIERLNALRNGLAHAYFPENLRALKPLWKGDDVFSIQGARRLREDCQLIFDHFAPLVGAP